MPRRFFRRTGGGQWAAPALEDAGGFPTDGRELADRIAATLGLAPGALEVVDVADGEPDPRTPPLLEDQNRQPPPPPPTPGRVEATALSAFVTANPDPATWTNAQLRDALIRLIRNELRRNGLA